MGDGNIDQTDGHCRFRVGMVNYKFLSWVAYELYNFVNLPAVRLQDEAGYRGGEREDYYMLRTISHPYFDSLREWYTDNGKKIPLEKPTPLELKMWYVADGGTMDGRPFIRIDSQKEQVKALQKAISKTGIKPSIVDQGKQLNILNDDRNKFFEYIGAPVPGFEYKWPSEKKA